MWLLKDKYFISLISLIAALSFSLNSKAQYYYHFSHYHLNGFVINPAYAGSRDVASAVVMHRDQWVGFPGAPSTQTISAHSPLKSINSAVGINMFTDKIGVSRHTGVFFDYAYRIRTGQNSRLSFGLSGGLSFYRSALHELATHSPGDEIFEGQLFKYTTPNFGMGILYYSQKFFVGLSMPVLFKYNNSAYHNPTDSLYVSPVNTFLQIGYIHSFNKDIKLKTSMMIKGYENFEGQLDFSSGVILYDVFHLGFSLRSQVIRPSFIALVEYQINDQFRIGYAHDFVISGLGKYNHGTHEIVLRYEPVWKANFVNTRFF